MKQPSSKLVVVGISGCSCTGKTTLAENLKQEFTDKGYNLHCIGQDSHYFADSQIPIDPASNYANWDSPEAIDMTEFYNSIHQYITNFNQSKSEQKTILIVEGFLFFHESRFLDLIDKLIFAYADYDVLFRRRNGRIYQTAEGFYEDPPNYFELIAYPSYLKYYKEIHELTELNLKSTNAAQFIIQHKNRDIFCLDSGKLSQQKMLESTIKYIFN